jgi:hypothetical protein
MPLITPVCVDTDTLFQGVSDTIAPTEFPWNYNQSPREVVNHICNAGLSTAKK